MHEIGHNLGSKHTQWCGWPGGPIDNCVDIEEITAGECETYINNPIPQVGTIMSYCHTSSIQSGGGIIMKFHDIVKSQIIDYISAIDLDFCDEEEDLLINKIHNNKLTLYPNPADNIIHIKTDNFLLEITTLELFNSLGQLTYRSNLNDNFSIDISNVSAGIYVAHFVTNEEIIKETIIIQ